VNVASNSTWTGSFINARQTPINGGAHSAYSNTGTSGGGTR
jgi:hypothetical protein